MFCPKCGTKLEENISFCPNCGTNLNEFKNNENRGVVQQSVEPVNNVSTSSVVNTEVMNVNNVNDQNIPNKMNKSKRDLLIILGIAFVLVIGVCLFFVFRKDNTDDSGNINNDNSNVQQTPDIDLDGSSTAKVTFSSTFDKLKNDYENGTIDVNKYFTELVNYNYDYDNLDSTYQISESVYNTGSISEIVQLFENHKNELSKDSVKKLVERALLFNVDIDGDDTVVEPLAATGGRVNTMLLSNEEDKEVLANHKLTTPYLSSNENFIIWYTTEGDDAVTLEQVKSMAAELESSITDYADMFGIDYSFKSKKDDLFNLNYSRARSNLKKNGIDVDKIDTAMSVYIFDTGSDSIMATYYNPFDTGVLIEMLIFSGLDDLIIGESGVVSYPYVVLNKKTLNVSEENLKSVANHELFHHFQYVYCEESIGARCPDYYYSEASANFASALVSEMTSANTSYLLNGWAGKYTQVLRGNLSDLADGYGQFPYYYTFTTEVSNWASILTPALAQEKPTEYIKNNTPKEDLVKVSAAVAHNTLTKSYKNNSLYTDKNVVFEEVISSPKTLTQTINAGAVLYYEVSGNNIVEVISGNSDYVGIKLYGYKDYIYFELDSSLSKVEKDLTTLSGGKYYIAIYNADIVNSNTFTINVKASSNSEDDGSTNDTEYITTFSNYEIEIDMDITVAGITTNSFSKGRVDELHQKEYLDVTTTSMGLVSVTNKVYYDYATGMSYMTQPYGGDVWYKSKSSSQTVDLGVILDKLKSMKNVTKVSDNHFKVKMTSDDVKGLMASGNASTATLNGDVYVDVYTENGYITKLEYDFTKLLKGFDLFTTTIKFSNYNNAGDVVIPQSVINNAVNQ